MKILFVGRLDTFKGVLTFVEAARLCPQDEFIICGDGPLKMEVLNRRSTLSNLQFLSWVSQQKVNKLMMEADIFCQLSPVENIWAASLIRAMKYEKAIICTDVGWTNRFLNEETVVLIPPQDPQALATAIKFTLKNSDVRKQFGKNAAEYVKENLLVDKIAKEVYDGIRETLR